MIDLAALPIFPCNLAKEPLTAHGFKDAKRGAKWKAWPLVGFPTGAKSGFDVLDIDPSGREWFDANYDALPTTRVHETQRGLHLLFKHAKGLGCSSGKIAEGIDVRADGGYAIWWPSTGRPIEDAPICEWPDWLLKEAMGDGLKKRNLRRSLSHPVVDDPVWVADCTSALRQMNAVDWRGDWRPWFELLMGCKYVGISLDDFVAWCVTDPRYANDAEKIARQWHSVVPAHGGAFGRELSKRKIRIRGRELETSEVPPNRAEPKSTSKPNLRRASARINSAIDAINRDPTERCLFWASCLCAEIVHECELNPSQITNLIAGNAYPALHKTLGKEGIRRTIENAFRHVEEKYLATPTDGQKGDEQWQKVTTKELAARTSRTDQPPRSSQSRVHIIRRPWRN